MRTEMIHVYDDLVKNINDILDVCEMRGLCYVKRSGWADVDELIETESILADLIWMLLMAYGKGMADGVIMNLIYRFGMDEGPGPYLKVVSEKE